MAEIRSFSSFKDWLLIIMTGAILTLVGNTWYNINYLMRQEVIRSVKDIENEKWKAKIELEISNLKTDQRETVKQVNEIIYLKPDEIKVKKRITDR